MRETFVSKQFKASTLAVIDQANEILAEYAEQGFVLTVRQLYYQFVARDLIPNSQSEYKKIVDVVKNARRAGLMDWGLIEDRTRGLETHAAWRSPSDILKAAAKS